ncbi:MAG TPA: polysaccharide biosynthesis C-terminal domain-containing protein [Sedimentisphaerales bacterium]|nr:polysaccharide biosynthesis C-terminal domain-containing protein [Sedimentisphaerales bacterium]
MFSNTMLQRIKQELEQGKTLLQFGFLNATGQVLGMIAPLVIAEYFSRFSKESAEGMFTSYYLAKMVVFFFATLLIAAAQTPFIVFANQEKAGTGRINKAFSVQLTFLLFSLAVFPAITLPLNKYIFGMFARITGGDLLFIELAFVGIALKSFLSNLFMAMNQRIKNSLVELVFGFFMLAIVLLLYWTDRINLRTVFLVYFISAVFVAIIFIKTIDFGQLRPFNIDRRLLKDMFSFTAWVMFGSAAVYFIDWGDSLVLRLLRPFGDTGTYGLGYQVFKGVAALTFIASAYFMPFVSQHVADSAKMRDYLFNKRPKVFLLGLVAIGLLFLVTPQVFKLVYGDVFRGSIAVLKVLFIGSVLILYSIFYDPILHSLKKFKFTQTVNVVQVLLNLLLDFWFVSRMGMIGAAVATVLAYFFRAAAMEIYFWVKLRKLLNL